MLGDAVSVRQPQITGVSKRPAYYLYGKIVARPTNAPALPLSGGFHYVQIDGRTEAQMVYAGKLHHVAPSALPAQADQNGVL